ncbi:unnamed protein product [Aphanomyces euteiches]
MGLNFHRTQKPTPSQRKHNERQKSYEQDDKAPYRKFLKLLGRSQASQQERRRRKEGPLDM